MLQLKFRMHRNLRMPFIRKENFDITSRFYFWVILWLTRVYTCFKYVRMAFSEWAIDTYVEKFQSEALPATFSPSSPTFRFFASLRASTQPQESGIRVELCDRRLFLLWKWEMSRQEKRAKLRKNVPEKLAGCRHASTQYGGKNEVFFYISHFHASVLHFATS